MHQLPNQYETAAIVAVFAFLAGLFVGMSGCERAVNKLIGLVGSAAVLGLLIALAADSAILGMVSVAIGGGFGWGTVMGLQINGD